MSSHAAEIKFKVPPVVKSVDFAGTPEQAFARFSEQIGKWWPIATHSVGRKTDDVSDAFERLEPGGRLIEHWSTGEAHVWGTLTACERPHHLAFTWHPGSSPGHAQLVEVTFTASGPEKNHRPPRSFRLGTIWRRGHRQKERLRSGLEPRPATLHVANLVACNAP
jgi:uncharacterized protein YndB with AHSA1/START domain